MQVGKEKRNNLLKVVCDEKRREILRDEGY